ncbi:MAG: hypothetical protein ACI8Z1_002340 [Candidatus Azotimanducaceae bacterium]|jgi:hypothetical protein
MVNIVGNVKAEDDFTHPLGPEENFNESVYFNFFDRNTGVGGFIRMGNRANEGYAETTVIVFQSDGSVFFNYKKPEISDNNGWNAGGTKIDVITAGEHIRTSYRGSVLHMQDPTEMIDPGEAFKSNPFKKIELDLDHFGVGPMYGHVGEAGDGNDFARAHYEQHMRFEGQLRVEGEAPVELSGHGVRDHSWGPRYWQSIRSYRWLTGNFSDDLGMALSVVGDHRGGMFYKGDELLKVTDIQLKTDYDEATGFHRGLEAQVVLENGDEHLVEGRVRGFIPLRNRRSEQVTHIGEGMTEYTLDGKIIGFGLSEYLNQPEDTLE